MVRWLSWFVVDVCFSWCFSGVWCHKSLFPQKREIFGIDSRDFSTKLLIYSRNLGSRWSLDLAMPLFARFSSASVHHLSTLHSPLTSRTNTTTTDSLLLLNHRHINSLLSSPQGSLFHKSGSADPSSLHLFPFLLQ